jgi:hypothetical protein
MTTLTRLFLIAAAALLVVGATLAWNQINPIVAETAGSQPPASRSLTIEGGAFPSVTHDQPDGGHEAGGLAAAGEVLKNVLVVGALTTVVAGGARLRELVRQSGRRASPHSSHSDGQG